MTRSLRREVRFLRVHAVTSSLVLVVLCTTAFREAAIAKFDEVQVGRINVVDANGALRLVISNKDRMHPGMMDGKLIDRPRPVAGVLFFNEEGDEVGGLTFTGRRVDGRGRANAGIMFDQFKQDQTPIDNKTIAVETADFMEADLTFRALAGATGLATSGMMLGSLGDVDGGREIMRTLQGKLAARAERTFERTGKDIPRGYGKHGYR